MTTPLPDGADPRAWCHGPRERRIAIGLAVAIVVLLAVVAFLPRLPQDPAYHAFCDRRAWLGVPNAGDVLSNLPFVVVGLLGLGLVAMRGSRLPGGGAVWAAFFLGVFATGFGSGYYHLAPDTPRLFWDRLPMTVAFMGLSAAIVADRLGARLGRALLSPMLVLGIASVLHWRESEIAGAGDLRWYALVQFLPMLAIPLVIAMTPRRAIAGRDIAIVIGCYALSKLLEHFDGAVLGAIGVSGHSLKHLAAAAATAWVLRMAWRIARSPAAPAGPATA